MLHLLPVLLLFANDVASECKRFVSGTGSGIYDGGPTYPLDTCQGLPDCSWMPGFDSNDKSGCFQKYSCDGSGVIHYQYYPSDSDGTCADEDEILVYPLSIATLNCSASHVHCTAYCDATEECSYYQQNFYSDSGCDGEANYRSKAILDICQSFDGGQTSLKATCNNGFVVSNWYSDGDCLQLARSESVDPNVCYPAQQAGNIYISASTFECGASMTQYPSAGCGIGENGVCSSGSNATPAPANNGSPAPTNALSVTEEEIFGVNMIYIIIGAVALCGCILLILCVCCVCKNKK